MAANLSNGLASLVETIAKAVVVNSMYLTRGAVRVPVDQMKGKRAGETYSFVLDNITAKYSTSLDQNGKVQLGAMGAPTKVNLKVAYSGSNVSLGAVSKALELGDWNELAKEVGAEVINEFVVNTAMADMAKAGAICHVSNASNAHTKKIAKEAGRLLAKFGGKIYGFASPEVIGEIQGEGRNIQPIEIDAAYGVGLEGKMGNIAELRNMILPSTITTTGTNTFAYTASTNTVAVAKGANEFVAMHKGDFVKLSGKDVYIYFTEDVAAAGSVTSCIVIGTDSNVSATAADTSDIYAPMIIRGEKAQAWGDAGDCLDGADTKASREGITVAQSEVKNGGFAVDHQFAMAGAAGVAVSEKVSVIMVKVG